ncbi:MAG TPA: TraM recognition domain-containing protein, partial [Sphingomicrobium sp.]
YKPEAGEVTPELPPYPDFTNANEVALVIGELHAARTPVPVARPRWLTIPARGLHTGIAAFGAIGSGKTSSCILPFIRQLVAYKATSETERIGGLVLEVKGDLCAHLRHALADAGRAEDFIEVGFESPYRYNPLHSDLDSYALAYSIAVLMNNLFGKGKEPFWQQAYTNMVKFVILLHKVLYDYVTLFDVYECAISPRVLAERIEEADQRFNRVAFIEVPASNERLMMVEGIERFGFEYDPDRKTQRARSTDELKEFLAEHQFDDAVEAIPKPLEPGQEYKRAQFEAVCRWFHDDWLAIDPKLRTSIVEGISVFLSLFDDNPDVKRIFCPPKEVYTIGSTSGDPDGIPLPPFAALVEQGKVCALNFPMALNPGLAKAIGTMMKLDYQRAVLLRIPAMERERHRPHRDTFFVCDEYQNFATVGGNDPNGDEKFFSMSRQARCIPIIATQSISSLKEALAGEGWRTLLQTFRTKIFLAQSDEFSIQTAAALCGKEDRLKVSYGLSEASTDARVSLLTGKTVSNKGTISATKTYATQKDFIFDERSFTLLRNAECIVIPFDGVNQRDATYCYLKPWYLDCEKSYWAQLRAGDI